VKNDWGEDAFVGDAQQTPCDAKVVVTPSASARRRGARRKASASDALLRPRASRLDDLIREMRIANPRAGLTPEMQQAYSPQCASCARRRRRKPRGATKCRGARIRAWRRRAGREKATLLYDGSSAKEAAERARGTAAGNDPADRPLRPASAGGS